MTAAFIIDVVLLVVGIAHVSHAAARGLLSGVAGLVGFFVAGAAAMVLIPKMLLLIDPNTDPTLLHRGATVLILLAAWLGLVIGADIPDPPETLPGQQRRRSPVDVLGGLGAGLVGFLLLCGCITQLIWYSGDVLLARAATNSRVLVATGSVWPDETAQWAFDVLPRRVATATGIPSVTTGPVLPGAGNTEPVNVDEMTRAAKIAAPSVLKITGVAAACAQGQEGSGVAVAPERVMTNAHVVAGVSDPLVQVTGLGRQYPAKVVYFDPAKDVAILAVPKLPAPALPVAAKVTQGDPVTAVGFPLAGPYQSAAGRIEATATTRGEDIYNERPVSREVHSASTALASGNSGGPLVNAQGEMAGLVFAKAANDDLPGYALTLGAIDVPLKNAANYVDPVQPGLCR